MMTARRKSKAKPLLAYEATDGGDGWCIVFATNGAAARRYAAGEMGTDFEGVERCRRKPEFDRWSPGPVPVQAQFEAGWWFECNGCGQRVSDGDEVDDLSGEPIPLNPVFHTSAVYCTPECEARECLLRAEEQAAEARAKLDMAAAVHSRWPGAVIKRQHAYAPAGKVEQATTEFMFPAGKYPASYDHLNPKVLLVSQCDVGAYHRFEDMLLAPVSAWESEGGALGAREAVS